MSKNRSKSTQEETPAGFQLVKGQRTGKPKLVTTAFQLNEIQDAHLTLVCEQQEVARAEFVKQAVFYCLESIGSPMPESGAPLDEAVLEKLQQKRAAKAERAARRAAGEDMQEDNE